MSGDGTEIGKITPPAGSCVDSEGIENSGLTKQTVEFGPGIATINFKLLHLDTILYDEAKGGEDP